MKTFGEIIRAERVKRGLYLRQVAAGTDIDQTIISKFETGERKPNREQVLRIVKFYGFKEDDLLIAWLSDKVTYDLQNEKLADKVLKVAEKKIAYKTKKKQNKHIR
ncbi:MAG: helix-turn-helix transcriptional regulator [Cytophagales bacterium]|nr:helix-turn-helix transcriptional regulator [Cytophagales bacterium]